MDPASKGDLDRLRQAIRTFVDEREWEPFHDPKNLAMAVASEAGELAAELRWVPSDAADDHCQQPKARQRLADEMADVAITLLMLADRTGIDLIDAAHDKLRKNAEKYPVKEHRGRY